MNPATKVKGQEWLKKFPECLATVMKKFQKGNSQFHLIALVSDEDTIKLWLSEYPQYCLDMIRKELSDERFSQEIKEFFELGEDELEDLEEYIKADEILISEGFLEHMIIEEDYGGMLPDTLFASMKDKIMVGDIVYSPYYESRMYYGISLACLNNKHEIVLQENEGHYPRVKLWQKRIMEYNKLSFDNAINHIENTYAEVSHCPGYLLEMWQ